MVYENLHFGAEYEKFVKERELCFESAIDIGCRNCCNQTHDAPVNALRYLGALQRLGYKELYAVEIWEPNYIKIQNNPYGITCLLMDARQIQAHFGENSVDLVNWFHGPEHLDREEASRTVEALKLVARKAVLIACPDGEHPQEALEKNPYEIHRSSFVAADFAVLGFQEIYDNDGALLAIFRKNSKAVG